MSTNNLSDPAGWVTVTTARHDNLLLTTDALTFALSNANAVAYEVRNYFGAIVASGAASGTSLTISALPVGWYKLYLRQSGSDANYGTLIGVAAFSVIEADSGLPSPPARGTTPSADPGFVSPDHIARGVALLGPYRNQISDAANPTLTSGANSTIAAVQADLTYQSAWYDNFQPDSARARPRFLQFPNGGYQDAAHTAGVTQTVQALYPSVGYFEGPINEPDLRSAATWATAMQAFYNAVKAGNAGAKVLGPNPVTVNGVNGGWNGIDNFLTAGGGAYIDALSFHAYNCINGDLAMGRRTMDKLKAVLTAHGLGGIELWQTEWGQFAAVDGVMDPRMQARWAMMHRFVLEQYGIPKERDYWFYDTSHGFWSYPSFWKLGDGTVMPMIPMMRVYSREIHGKTWTAALDFGTVENNHYIGSNFTGSDGSSVLTLLSGGRTDGSVSLRVTGATAVTVVNAFGVTSTVACSRFGLATVPVANEPVYVRVPTGVTATVEQVLYGTNLTRLGADVTVDGARTNRLRVVNTTLENSYYDNVGGVEPTEFRDDATLPAQVTVTLDAARPFDTVVVLCPTPWQDQGTLLDYDLEYRDAAGSWHTLQTVTEPANVIPARSSLTYGGGIVDSYHSGRSIFVHTFTPVTGTAVRLTVRDATYGGAADSQAAAAGGFAGSHKIRVREIEVYSRDTQVRRPLAVV